ncbi:hypothetical protein MHK71_10650 [Kocuria indica]|uniref:hypothetical protein n=1 Tax=Kocuria marina TaxID=223184 RepID=UPI001EF55641|nr:hypothetical protein [Kocuria indica]MCG7432938.1 hypothetical protein [Kocuria indica]
MLVVLTAWRVVVYPQRVLEDLHVPARAFGFFTGVAGTNVVAVCLIALGETVPAALLLAACGVRWLLLGYLVPWFAVLGRAGGPCWP